MSSRSSKGSEIRPDGCETSEPGADCGRSSPVATVLKGSSVVIISSRVPSSVMGPTEYWHSIGDNHQGFYAGGTLSSAEIDRTGRAREQNLQAIGIDVVDGWCACSPSKGQIVSGQAAVRNVTSGPTRDAAAPGAEGLRRGRQRRAIDAQSRRLVCSCIVGESSKINALDLRTGVCNKFGNTCALRSPLSTEVRLPADPGQARRLCGEVRPVPCTAVRFVEGPYLPGNASA